MSRENTDVLQVLMAISVQKEAPTSTLATSDICWNMMTRFRGMSVMNVIRSLFLMVTWKGTN